MRFKTIIVKSTNLGDLLLQESVKINELNIHDHF